MEASATISKSFLAAIGSQPVPQQKARLQEIVKAIRVTGGHRDRLAVRLQLNRRQ